MQRYDSDGFICPHRIELPTDSAVGSVNVYLFTQPKPVLVDAGLKSPTCLDALQARLAIYNLTIADLTQVIITHPHVDHLGLAGLIATQSQAKIGIWHKCKPWLVDPQKQWRERKQFLIEIFHRLALTEQIRQPLLDGLTKTSNMCDPVPEEHIITFEVDDVLMLGRHGWRVLHTPGHASTVTCFYQPETQQLLSTDMLMPITPAPVIEPSVDGDKEQSSLPLFLRSLARLETLAIQVAYPGHGDIITNPSEVISYQRNRIQIRKQECFEFMISGITGTSDLLVRMYPQYASHHLFPGLSMLKGYLDLLVAEGLIERILQDDIWYHIVN